MRADHMKMMADKKEKEAADMREKFHSKVGHAAGVLQKELQLSEPVSPVKLKHLPSKKRESPKKEWTLNEWWDIHIIVEG